MNVCLFSMVCLSGLHKAKLGSQIKKLFWQFHYFSKAAAAHITQDIARKPFFKEVSEYLAIQLASILKIVLFRE